MLRVLPARTQLACGVGKCPFLHFSWECGTDVVTLCLRMGFFVIFKALPLILVAEDGNGIALFLVWPYTRARSL